MERERIIKYIGKEWFDILEPAFEKHWETISKKIKNEKKPITPKLGDVFRMYKECPVDKFNTLFLSSGPYHELINNKLVADGIGFSSLNSKIAPLELQHLRSSWNKTYNEWTNTNDLSYISNQGVLLLNSSLTTEVGKTNNHLSIWKEFTEHCLALLNFNFTGLNYVFVGNQAQKFKNKISETNNYVYDINYPTPIVEVWDDENIFEIINNNLKDKNLNTIQWIK